MTEIKKLAVIGDPITHSLSPLLQNTMAQTLGLPYIYDAQRVCGGELPQWLHRVREEGYVGFNATMPHKLDLLDLLDNVTQQGLYFGAVNTVRNDNGVLTGTNTDGAGFAQSLSDHGLGFHGRTVAILGAGGSAGAIAKQAVLDGAARISIYNRTVVKAEALCAMDPVRMRALPLEAEISPDTELLINTIPVGNNLDVSFVKKLSKWCAVFDILYAPPKTPLLLAAEDRGLMAVNGLGMLLHQAIESFSFFTGVPVAHGEMAAILFEKLRQL